MSLLRKLLAQNSKKNYIQFEDQVVAKICAETWGDGKGITYQQASMVTTLSNKFTNNTEITSFNELQYFTNLQVTSAAFSGCTYIKEISLPNSLTALSASAFDGCSRLYKIKNLDNIKTIGDKTFRNCAVESISFPNLATIGEASLARMTNLKTMNIPKVKLCNSYCFKSNTLMETITFDKDNCTTIKSEAFSLCSSLKLELNFPNLITLGNDAFYMCTSISGSVSFPKLSTIGSRALARTGIEQITDLGTITSVPAYTFAILPNLTFCKIPNTVTSINSGFMDNCPKLTTLILLPETPPTIINSAEMFQNCSDNLKIYVPDDSVENYKAANIWSKWSELFYPISKNNE